MPSFHTVDGKNSGEMNLSLAEHVHAATREVGQRHDDDDDQDREEGPPQTLHFLRRKIKRAEKL